MEMKEIKIEDFITDVFGNIIYVTEKIENDKVYGMIWDYDHKVDFGFIDIFELKEKTNDNDISRFKFAAEMNGLDVAQSMIEGCLWHYYPLKGEVYYQLYVDINDEGEFIIEVSKKEREDSESIYGMCFKTEQAAYARRDLLLQQYDRGEMMPLNEYQNAAKTTAIFDKKYDVIYPALGLNGEAGEVAEKVKKVIRDHNGEMTDETKLEIVKEIGDVMWYCAVLADRLGYTLKEVANINIEKLASRKKRNMINGNGDNR